MDRSKVAIIIPAWNEEKSIAKVVTGSLHWGIVIVVDDGSSDDTILNSSNAGAIVLRKIGARGYDSSIEEGFSYASSMGFEVAITLDADGQHDPDFLPLFLKKIDIGCEVVIGIRDSVHRAGEKLFCFLGQIFLGVSDPLCGLKAYKMTLYNRLGHFDSYKSIGTELVIHAVALDMKIGEVPISISERKDKPRFGNKFISNLKIIRSIFL
jgi:glycosyltransferase involved in cell wall biosynthesis